MKKAELTKAVAQRTGLSQKEAAAALEAALEAVTEALAAGDRVQLTGFGTLTVKERAPHIGRNLATGEPMEVKGFRAVQFKAGKQLKERIQPDAAGE